MKKIVFGLVIIILIITLTLRVFYEKEKINICFEKFCSTDCGFSPLPNEELQSCIEKEIFILKYIRKLNNLNIKHE